ncbi:MAG: sigma-54-dependent Fis family transcriptional regulator, partial [Acidobacteria bacterium]|nr:sigma-54-dependent Fis family transcriptional regulator [Acidobacteriota bacterium]
PGNVRELRSEVFRWTVFCDQRVRPVDLSLEAGVGRAGRADSSSAPAVGPLAAAVTELERRLVARVSP